jgi:formate hydrogenlyase subunit 6/NADH:ubiquinone oxidoreductase subunit I
MQSIRSFFKAFLLWELFQGMWVTLKNMFRPKVTINMEARGENIMTKDMLLAVGERYEAMIAADKAADAPYR